MDETKPPEPPKQEEPEKPSGSVKIEEGVLLVRIPLNQKNAKFLAKGLLIDAINTVDEYFFILRQRQLATQEKMFQHQKTVIDSVIRPNGSKGVH
jgi:hypothetical protein